MGFYAMREDRQAINRAPGGLGPGLSGVDSTDLSTEDLSKQTSRIERLATIREAIVSGSYRVDSVQIAGKLVKFLSGGATSGPVDQASDKDQEHC